MVFTNIDTLQVQLSTLMPHAILWVAPPETPQCVSVCLCPAYRAGLWVWVLPGPTIASSGPFRGWGKSRDSSGHLTSSPAAALPLPVMAFFLHRQLHQQMITSSSIAIGIVLIFLFEASLVFAWKNTDTKNICNQDYEFHHVTILNVTEEASVLLDGCVLSKATVSFHFLSQLGQVVQAQ